jgi:hypothetical protein
MPFDPTNTFILSPNKNRSNPKAPQWRGEVNIKGEVFEIAGWERKRTSDGAPFISGPVKPKQPRQAQQAEQAHEEPKREDPAPRASNEANLDEDVPF